jgi:hypothetical protein
MEQIQKETNVRKERRERQAVKSLDATIASLIPLTSALTQAVLMASGFHQQKREWRKRRV